MGINGTSKGILLAFETEFLLDMWTFGVVREQSACLWPSIHIGGVRDAKKDCKSQVRSTQRSGLKLRVGKGHHGSNTTDKKIRKKPTIGGFGFFLLSNSHVHWSREVNSQNTQNQDRITEKFTFKGTFKCHHLVQCSTQGVRTSYREEILIAGFRDFFIIILYLFLDQIFRNQRYLVFYFPVWRGFFGVLCKLERRLCVIQEFFMYYLLENGVKTVKFKALMI